MNKTFAIFLLLFGNFCALHIGAMKFCVSEIGTNEKLNYPQLPAVPSYEEVNNAFSTNLSFDNLPDSVEKNQTSYNFLSLTNGCMSPEELNNSQLIEELKFAHSINKPEIEDCCASTLAQKILCFKTLKKAEPLIKSVTKLDIKLANMIREKTRVPWKNLFQEIAKNSSRTLKKSDVIQMLSEKSNEIMLLNNGNIRLFNVKTGKQRKCFYLHSTNKAVTKKMRRVSDDLILVHSEHVPNDLFGCTKLPKTMVTLWKLGRSRSFSKINTCKRAYQFKLHGQKVQNIVPLGNNLTLLNCIPWNNENNLEKKIVLLNSSSGKVVNSFIPQGNFHEAGLYDEKTAIIVLKGEQPTALVYDTATGLRCHKITLPSSNVIISEGLFLVFSEETGNRTKITKLDPTCGMIFGDTVLIGKPFKTKSGQMVFQNHGNGNLSFIMDDNKIVKEQSNPEHLQYNTTWYHSNKDDHTFIYSAKINENDTTTHLKQEYYLKEPEKIKAIDVRAEEEILIALTKTNKVKKWMLPPFKKLSFDQIFLCAMLAKNKKLRTRILKRPKTASKFWQTIVKSLPQEIKNGLKNLEN